MAITTVLMMKRVFNLSFRALQGFVDSIFKLMELPQCYPDYSLVSKRAKRVNISIKTPIRAETAVYRIKTQLGGHLSLRDYDAQVGEAMVIQSAEPDDVVGHAAP